MMSNQTGDLEVVTYDNVAHLKTLQELHIAKIDAVQSQADFDKQLTAQATQHLLYSSTKSVGQNLLNLGVITGYIQILISIFGTGEPLDGFNVALIVLIAFAMVNQITIFVLVSMLYAASTEQVTRTCTATSLNNLVTSLTALSLIGNVAITAIAAKNTTTPSAMFTTTTTSSTTFTESPTNVTI